MEIHTRFKYLREAIWFYIVLMLCQMAAEIIVLYASGGAELGAVLSQAALTERLYQILADNTYRMTAISYLLMTLYLLHKRRKSQGPLVLSDGLDRRLPLSAGLWCVVLGMGGCVWSGVLMELLPEKVSAFESYVSDGAALVSTEPLWLQAVVSVLVAAFFEELIFRGLIFSRFRLLMHPVGALFCQALTFASLQGSGAQSVFALIFGMVMGLSVMQTGSLRSAVVIHMAYNLAVFLAEPSYDRIFGSPDIVKGVLLVSGCVFALGAWMLLRGGRRADTDK